MIVDEGTEGRIGGEGGGARPEAAGAAERDGGTEGGRLHVYTGNGKGKTTAALGLALRAAGHGRRVGVIQFLKGWPFYGEIEGLARLGIRLERTGRPDYVRRGQDIPQDREEAARGLALAREWLASGAYDLVVLDEINVATDYGLLDPEAVLEALRGRAKGTEAVLTGRYAPEAFREAADYVTEMREEKHPFRSGLRAREGVEY
jgi:cob(I)alamin adenosyltransferase